MSSVYLVKEKDSARVRHFYDKAALYSAGFAQADKIVTDSEFNRNGGYASVVDGDIVVGIPELEKKKAEAAYKIGPLKSKLASLDYIGARIAEGSLTKEEAADKIAEREALREQIRQLQAQINE